MWWIWYVICTHFCTARFGVRVIKKKKNTFRLSIYRHPGGGGGGGGGDLLEQARIRENLECR
jgi:hypothetical protein